MYLVTFTGWDFFLPVCHCSVMWFNLETFWSQAAKLSKSSHALRNKKGNSVFRIWVAVSFCFLFFLFYFSCLFLHFIMTKTYLCVVFFFKLYTSSWQSKSPHRCSLSSHWASTVTKIRSVTKWNYILYKPGACRR